MEDDRGDANLTSGASRTAAASWPRRHHPVDDRPFEYARFEYTAGFVGTSRHRRRDRTMEEHS